MDRAEIDFRWTNQESIPGVVFGLNDSVRVLVGPHAGEAGATIALLEMGPEPRYRVELGSGADVDANQSELSTVHSRAPDDALAVLQRWYGLQADGEWEHEFGIRIETLDNPGWQLEIDLAGTSIEDRLFAEITDLEPKREWIRCWVEDRRWRAACGPLMLERAVHIFLKWASSSDGTG